MPGVRVCATQFEGAVRGRRGVSLSLGATVLFEGTRLASPGREISWLSRIGGGGRAGCLRDGCCRSVAALRAGGRPNLLKPEYVDAGHFDTFFLSALGPPG